MTVANFEIAPARPDSSTRKSRNARLSSQASKYSRTATTRTSEAAGRGHKEQPLKDFTPVPPISPDRVQALRDRYFEVHQPESAAEFHLVDSLVFARSKLDTAENDWNERLRWQQAHAAELFERGELQRFQADLKLWRSDPWGMQAVFGKTWHSAKFLSDLWQSVLEALDSKAGMTFDQIKHLILVIGGDWRVDRLDALRGRLMGSFLALHPEAEKFLDHWVSASRARRPDRAAIDIELDRLRARAFLESAPPAEFARKSLRELAEKECSVWAAHAKRLHAAHLEERARCAETCPAHPLGDAADVRETRRLRRVLNTAANRFEMLERRLLRLIASRIRSKPRKAESVTTTNPPSRPARHELTQTIETHKDRTQLRNGSTGAPRTDTISSEPTRPARRPDPVQAAKAWRAKHGKGKSA